jgi:hypothetical protein
MALPGWKERCGNIIRISTPHANRFANAKSQNVNAHAAAQLCASVPENLHIGR